MGVYADLNLRPVINAAATWTKLGGSRMPKPVVDEMAAAARSFVDLAEMQQRVGARIAELTGNEAVHVSSGAAAGIAVAVAACIAGTDPEKIGAFPYLDGIERSEVIVHASQRNGYDYAARQTGARLIEIGERREDLDAAISERTACVLWFAGAHFASGALPLGDVIEIAHARGLPVVVDAAAQIPPVSNLWRFTREMGADLVIFSGGKGLRGPQSSGLVIGRTDLIEACRLNASPHYAIGRPMKVGKEELAGLLAAVEWTLAQDEETLLASYEATVRDWIEGLSDIPGVSVERGFPSEAGQPHARAIVRIEPPSPWTRGEVIRALWDGEPRVAIMAVLHDDHALALNPQTLEPGEESTVLDCLVHVLTSVPVRVSE